jgi:hypothetical protein
MRFVVAFAFATLTGDALSEMPSVFVDAGACPGEGCGYCALYAAKVDLPVFDKPSTSAKRVGEMHAGDTFISKTGEVHTIPTRFEVHKGSGPFKPGDDVYAVTYLGEGYFRVFHNGELVRADLGFSPWGGGAGKTCDKPKYCFGQLSKELEFTWWIFVLSETGLEGWVVANESIRWIERNR